ncbi:MAG: TIR domain-containing protein [Bacteroidales bacterium]|nr:TIR domain-containing protein [Bacteroidales bacterium]
MALFTEERLRNRARNLINKGGYGSIYDSYETRAKSVLSKSLNEQRTFSAQSKIYDIFLSHSSSDAEIVAGLKLEIEDLGYSVYVDWIEDPLLSRANVTKETALVLQERMKKCKSLIYAFSENASSSKWMPWELGYFDALKGTVAVLPISKTSKSSFIGSEYLGIYYYIQIEKTSGTNELALWIHETSSKYVIFNSWLGGSKPFQR